jgi:hypothetical protein
VFERRLQIFLEANKKQIDCNRNVSAGRTEKMQNAAGAGRRAFGPQWFAKLGLISFAAGGLLEFAMIKSGFCTTCSLLALHRLDKDANLADAHSHCLLAHTPHRSR